MHLLSVWAHHVGLTLTQQAVAAKTNEIKAVETVFGQIVLTGRIVTMDALLTQRQVAQTIVEAGGDYVMIVKENQPQLKADIALVFTLPPVGDRQESTRTVDVANRAMTLFTSLGPSADCRGLTQVPIYQVRTSYARGAAFSVSQRGFSLSWGLQGKVVRTPH